MWVTLLVIILELQSLCSYELVSDYLDPCMESDECTDHRFVCIPDENGTRRCICDRFHKWGGDEEGCIQIYNFKQIINMTYVHNDVEEKLHNRMIHIFGRHAAAAYFVIGVMAISLLIVVLYCYRIRKKDSQMKRIVFGIENKPCPEYVPSTADV